MKRIWFSLIVAMIMSFSISGFCEVNRTPSDCFKGRYMAYEVYDHQGRIDLTNDVQFATFSDKEIIFWVGKVKTCFYYQVRTLHDADNNFANLINTTPNINEQTGIIITDLGMINNRHSYQIDLFQDGVNYARAMCYKAK